MIRQRIRNIVSALHPGYCPQLPNDSTKVLNGVGNWVTVSGAGGGIIGPLEQHTASSSASLDFTTFLSSAYDDYLFEFIGLVPANNAAVFALQLGTGAGPTWDTSADYRWASWATDNASATGASGSSSTGPATRITMHTTVSNTASNGGVGGHMQLKDPQNNTASKVLTFQVAGFSGSSTWGNLFGSGQFIPTTTLTGVRFQFFTGTSTTCNITSGTIRVYGLAK